MMETRRKDQFYMLIGLPGSGKSSVAMKMMDEYSFFEMMATSVVTDPMDADVVVTDKLASIS